MSRILTPPVVPTDLVLVFTVLSYCRILMEWENKICKFGRGGIAINHLILSRISPLSPSIFSPFSEWIDTNSNIAMYVTKKVKNDPDYFYESMHFTAMESASFVLKE